jgi:hypothetical protein
MGKVDSRIVVAAGNASAQIEYWKQSVAATMHFNDMCIRLRVLSVTVLATFFAGAAVSTAQYPNGVISLLGIQAHLSAALYLIALIFVSTLWLLDRAYYYKMLIATVAHSECIETRLREVIHDMVSGPTLTEAISAAIPRKSSSWIANLFYFTQVFLSVAMIYLAIHFELERAEVPIPVETASSASGPYLLRDRFDDRH